MVTIPVLMRVLIIYVFSATAIITEAKASITYFVYKESLGLYQSPHLKKNGSSSIGFFNELVAKLFAHESVEVQVVVMPALRVFSKVVKPLDNPWILIAFDDMSPAKEINTGNEVITTQQMIVARYRLRLFQVRSGALTVLDNRTGLRGKRIIQIKGGRYRAFEALVRAVEYERLESQYPYALRMLLAGRGDYLLGSDVTIKWHMQDIGEDYSLIQPVKFPDLDQQSNTISIVWDSSMPDDIERRIVMNISRLEENGWLGQLREQYGLLNP